MGSNPRPNLGKLLYPPFPLPVVGYITVHRWSICAGRME
jgi:hypothetical protein